MKDRIVEFPNRYRMVKTDQADVVDLIPEPGEITEVGTPINKATLLSDKVAELYGNVETVNEALENVANGANQCVVFFDACYPGTQEPVTGAYSFSVKGAGVSITFTTNGSKRRIPIVLAPGSYSVKMTSNAVIPFDSAAISFTVTFGDNHKTIFLFTTKPSVTLFSSSGTYKIDARMIQTLAEKIDVSVVGGGGGGAQIRGGGGGGGYVTSELIGKELFISDTITVTIGAGGVEATAGGVSRLQIGSKTIYANGGFPGEYFSGGSTGRGGGGGSGGGAFNANGGSYGGNGMNGQNGTIVIYGGAGQGNTYVFSATGTGTFAVSGGGGGAGYYDSPAPQGGTPGGGNGGNGGPGGNGSYYGAGGGSGSQGVGGGSNRAGTGHAGLVAIRING